MHHPRYGITHISRHFYTILGDHHYAWSHIGPKLNNHTSLHCPVSFLFVLSRHIKSALTESMAAILGASSAQCTLDYANSITYSIVIC